MKQHSGGNERHPWYLVLLAGAFELLPYPFLAAFLLMALRDDENDIVAIIAFGGLFVTGVGWLFLARWQAALGWFAARGLLFLLVLAMAMTASDADAGCVSDNCEEGIESVLLLLVVWIILPIASAGAPAKRGLPPMRRFAARL